MKKKILCCLKKDLGYIDVKYLVENIYLTAVDFINIKIDIDCSNFKDDIKNI